MPWCLCACAVSWQRTSTYTSVFNTGSCGVGMVFTSAMTTGWTYSHSWYGRRHTVYYTWLSILFHSDSFLCPTDSRENGANQSVTNFSLNPEARLPSAALPHMVQVISVFDCLLLLLACNPVMFILIRVMYKNGTNSRFPCLLILHVSRSKNEMSGETAMPPTTPGYTDVCWYLPGKFFVKTHADVLCLYTSAIRMFHGM